MYIFLEVHLCTLTLCPSSFTLACCLCYTASFILILTFFPYYLHVNYFQLFFLLHNSAVVLCSSLVALPGLRRDMVSLAVAWFCTENHFLVSLSSTSSNLHKSLDYESLELVLCFSSIEKLKHYTSSIARGLILPSSL